MDGTIIEIAITIFILLMLIAQQEFQKGAASLELLPNNIDSDPAVLNNI